MSSTNPIVRPTIKDSVQETSIAKSRVDNQDQVTQQTLYAKRDVVNAKAMSDANRVANSQKYKHDIENIQEYENMVNRKSHSNDYHGLYMGTNVDTSV
jgi:hypothetical protein